MGLRIHMAIAARDASINGVIASSLMPMGWRPHLLNFLGHHIHPEAQLHPRSFIGAFSGLSVGENAVINYGCFLDLGAPISIGDRSFLGMQVTIITGSHQIGTADQRCGDVIAAPVTIGDGCWIGARTTVLPGVTIGDGCVIGAGSVVREDCQPQSVYAGVPARLIREFDE